MSYNISRKQANVAAAVYAGNVTITFNFTEHFSYPAVSSAIDEIQFLDEPSLNLENALNVAKTNVFPTGRANVPDVLVIFVTFSLSGNFAAASQELRKEGVKVVVIGIGSFFSLPQLEAVASTPADNYVVTTGYDHMDTMEGAVTGAVCQGMALIFMIFPFFRTIVAVYRASFID